MEKVKEKQVLRKGRIAPKKSILVVDDEKEVLELLCEALTSEEYLICTAQDGLEAVGILKSERIDLLLVDIRIPGLSGIEVLREAKQINPDLEGIVITGYASLDTAIEAVKCGAFDYIEKPFRNIADVNKPAKSKTSPCRTRNS